MAVRAVRGASDFDSDEREHMLGRVAEMVLDAMGGQRVERGRLHLGDLHRHRRHGSEFPAYAARQLGFGDVPLLCARELEIEGSLPRVVRMLAHVETDLPRADVTHGYLHGAAAAQGPDPGALGPGRMSTPHRPVLVVGAGLLGTSIALAARRAGLEVLLRDVSAEHLRTASGLGAGRPVRAADQPQLVVVAVPPDHLGGAVADALASTDAVVTDVG